MYQLEGMAMQVELLTRVRLDPKQAILCQCKGCNRRVYADVHVLNLNGQVTVFGKSALPIRLANDNLQKPTLGVAKQNLHQNSIYS